MPVNEEEIEIEDETDDRHHQEEESTTSSDNESTNSSSTKITNSNTLVNENTSLVPVQQKIDVQTMIGNLKQYSAEELKLLMKEFNSLHLCMNERYLKIETSRPRIYVILLKVFKVKVVLNGKEQENNDIFVMKIGFTQADNDDRHNNIINSLNRKGFEASLHAEFAIKVNENMKTYKQFIRQEKLFRQKCSLRNFKEEEMKKVGIPNSCGPTEYILGYLPWVNKTPEEVTRAEYEKPENPFSTVLITGKDWNEEVFTTTQCLLCHESIEKNKECYCESCKCNNMCEDCVVDCKSCLDFVCEECVLECVDKNCKKRLCGGCAIKCDSCREPGCLGCINFECSRCEENLCSSCVEKCGGKDCNRWFCDECLENRCNSCEQYYCGNCAIFLKSDLVVCTNCI